MQGKQFFDARLKEVGADSALLIEYQGSTLRLPGYPRPDNRPLDDFTARKIGQIGVATFEPASEGTPAFYRFEPYADQTMRRAFELDVFERPPRPGMGHDGYNDTTLGWRSESQPDGFHAPNGIIPGKDGAFIQDQTQNITISIPPEFFALCDDFNQEPESVLRGFIADACGLNNYLNCPRADGYSSNGSDERMQAYAYIERAYATFRDES